MISFCPWIQLWLNSRPVNTLAKMNRLRVQIETFAAHAKVLNSRSSSFDSRTLLEEANRLLQELGDARGEFLGASS